MIGAKLRIARPTDQLEKLVLQYESGLGLEVLGGFREHDGFDGTMLGHPDLPWHLEFTAKDGHFAGRAPTEDNLLVFYLGEQSACEARCKSLSAAGFQEVAAFNPYWDRVGRTFEDLDGYRVVIVPGSWPAS
jgi:hypothetical protein